VFINLYYQYIFYRLFLFTHLNIFYNESFNYLLNKYSYLESEALWNKLTPIYAIRYKYCADINYLRSLIKLCKKNDLKKILEFGCSSMMNLRYMQNSMPDSFIFYGIDIIKIKINKFFFSLDLFKDEMDPALSETSFDLVFTRATLQHIPLNEVIVIIKKLSGILSPGAYFCINEANSKGNDEGLVVGHRVRSTFLHNYKKVFLDLGFNFISKQGNVLIFTK
jgi:hypothetical protein